MPWHLHSWHFKSFRRHLDIETYGRLPWQFYNFTCEITNYRWNFAPKLKSNSSPMILPNLIKQNFSCWINFDWVRLSKSSSGCIRSFVIYWIKCSFILNLFIGGLQDTDPYQFKNKRLNLNYQFAIYVIIG